jgi:hypothetical protein
VLPLMLSHRRLRRASCPPSESRSSSVADKGDSGLGLNRWFCAECGSPIWTEAEAMPGAAIVKTGCFDDTRWLKPTLQIYCDSRQDWAPLAGETANFPKMPG